MSVIARIPAYSSAALPRFGESRPGSGTGTVPGPDEYRPSAPAPLSRDGCGPLSVDYPPSLERNAVHPRTNRTLHLRQWANHGEKVEDQPKKAPVVLMVHGLAGRGEWQAPLIEKILSAPGRDANPVLVYTITLPEIALSDYGEGHIAKKEDLVAKVREAIEYLGEEHDSPVYAVGKSLGGLLLTDIAADPPKELLGMSLVSPAYKAVATKSDKAKVVFLRTLRSARLLEKEKVSNAVKALKRKPTKDQQASRTAYPQGLSLLQQKILREQNAGKAHFELTPGSYLEILDLMEEVQKHKLREIKLPMQVFSSEQDTEIDQPAIVEAVHDMPNTDYKSGIVYPTGNHDLVVDPRLNEMAADINERIDELLAHAAK